MKVGEIPSAFSRAVDWLFLSRRTGKIVVAQMPNVPLVLLFALWIVKAFVQPAGDWGRAVSIGYSVALIVWSGGEIVHGVNPWRRTLGGAVLIGWLISAW